MMLENEMLKIMPELWVVGMCVLTMKIGNGNKQISELHTDTGA